MVVRLLMVEIWGWVLGREQKVVQVVRVRVRVRVRVKVKG